MAKKDARIAVVADTHCGSTHGLTPPIGWVSETTEEKKLLRKLQEEMWGVYRKMLKKIQPVDILFALGDLIDGKQKRQGSRGLLTVDRDEQGDWAVSCLSYVGAKKKVFVGGTPYHVGDDEDFERRVAKEMKGEFYLRKFVEIDGYPVVFDLRHFIPGSSIPHGRYTPLAKDVLWNDLWTLANMQPKADVTLRAHVHYYADLGTANPDHRAIVVPGLQAPGGMFGARKMNTKIDFGIAWIDVTAKGNFTWDYEVATLEGAKAEPLVL